MLFHNICTNSKYFQLVDNIGSREVSASIFFYLESNLGSYDLRCRIFDSDIIQFVIIFLNIPLDSLCLEYKPQSKMCFELMFDR